jgi:tetratricopeptide (TPR) repeat protein
MSTAERVQRKQLIRSAEGYLDLIMAFDDCWPLAEEFRVRLAQRALDALGQIKTPQGHKPYILFLKGQAERARGQYDSAVLYLQQSAQLDPENIHTFLALGWCYKRLDRTDLAIGVMETAVQIDNSSAIAHYNLACYFALDRQVKRAISHLSQALELNPVYRDYIDGEADFDGIRNDPDFVASLGMIV